MLDNNGDKFPPCGVPFFVGCITPFSNTPLCKNFLISDIRFPSLTVLLIIPISLSWFTSSKNDCKSMNISLN
mgnify:CR=1 FL=1